MIVYFTPPWRGISATAALRPEESIGQSELYSLNLWHSHAGLTLGAAYETHGKMMTGTDSDDDGELDLSSQTAESGVRFACMYLHAGCEITALYERLYDLAGIAGETRTAVGGGIACSIDAHKLKAQYYWTDGLDNKSSDGGNSLAAGWEVALSADTTVYTAFAMTVNDNWSTYSISTGSHGDQIDPVMGENPVGISVGIIHVFERESQ